MIRAPMQGKGIPADVTRVTNVSALIGQERPTAMQAALQRMGAQKLKDEEGYRWFRFTTDIDRGLVYMEAWKKRPAIEGKLNKAAAVTVSGD